MSARSALLLCCAIACGDRAQPIDATTSSMPDVNVAVCGAIGTPCGNGCPAGLECVNNVCASVRGDCGGFTGAECQDTSLTCTYPSGSSGGICMRPEEKACLCAAAPTALGDCMQP